MPRRTTSTLLALAFAAGSALAATQPLAPARPGWHATGLGVDAEFRKVADDWHQSSVLWNDTTAQFGSGAPIGSFSWGTGLWGLADWQTAHQSPAPGMVEATWRGRVSRAAFGDEVYNTLYGASWGSVPLAPLFTAGAPASQDNWTAHLTGYVRISTAGVYNFGVLHDDGFFLKLGGKDQTLTLENDFLNPRDTLGFGTDLALGRGLYSFELGAYDRIEAGVVQLSWSRNGGAWSAVPENRLVVVDHRPPVPEPATAALWLAGLLGLAALARRRRPAPL